MDVAAIAVATAHSCVADLRALIVIAILQLYGHIKEQETAASKCGADWFAQGSVI